MSPHPGERAQPNPWNPYSSRDDDTDRMRPEEAPPPPEGWEGHPRPDDAWKASSTDEIPRHHPERVGNYRILEKVAEGGMGVVYKALQPGLNRIVALKLIRAGLEAGEEDVFRFLQEAKIAARLNHPCIVPIYEIGETAGCPFFTMEFVEGKTLSRLLRDGGISTNSAFAMVEKLTGALEMAHARGIFHRDLKPSNVMIDAYGNPRIMDFGLAKSVAVQVALTQTGVAMGTPAYMSPEQAEGDLARIDHRTDIYALGAILYECLSGRPPFEGGGFYDTLKKVLEGEAPRLKTLVPDIEPEVQAIVEKAMDPDLSRRYSTVAELRVDLRRYLDGLPVAARPVGSLRRARRLLARNMGITVLGGLLLLATALLVAYYMVVLPGRKEKLAQDRERALLEQTQTALLRVAADVEREIDFLSQGPVPAEAHDRALSLAQSLADPTFLRIELRKRLGAMKVEVSEEDLSRCMAEIDRGPLTRLQARAYARAGALILEQDRALALHYLFRAYVLAPDRDAGLEALLLVGRQALRDRTLPVARRAFLRVLRGATDDDLKRQALLMLVESEAARGRYEEALLLAKDRDSQTWTDGRTPGGMPVQRALLESLCPVFEIPDRARRICAGKLGPSGPNAILLATDGGILKLYAQDKDHGFVLRETYEVESPPSFLGLGDFTGDGEAQILMVERDAADRHLWIVTAADLSGEEVARGTVRGGIQTMIVADAVGDERAEAILGMGPPAGGGFVLQVQGDHFQAAALPMPSANTYVPALHAFDADGDDRNEIVAGLAAWNGYGACLLDLDQGWQVVSVRRVGSVTGIVPLFGHDARHLVAFLVDLQPTDPRAADFDANASFGPGVVREGVVFFDVQSGNVVARYVVPPSSGWPFRARGLETFSFGGRTVVLFQREDGGSRLVFVDEQGAVVAEVPLEAESVEAVLDLDQDGDREIILRGEATVRLLGLEWSQRKPRNLDTGLSKPEAPLSADAIRLHCARELLALGAPHQAAAAFFEIAEAGGPRGTEARLGEIDALVEAGREKAALSRCKALREASTGDVAVEREILLREVEIGRRLLAWDISFEAAAELLGTGLPPHEKAWAQDALGWSRSSMAMEKAPPLRVGFEKAPDPATVVGTIPFRMRWDAVHGAALLHLEREPRASCLLPVRYGGGPVHLEADIELPGPIWATPLEVGFFPAEPDRDSFAAFTLFLWATGPAESRQLSIRMDAPGGGLPLSAGIPSFEGRYRFVLDLYYGAGLSRLRVFETGSSEPFVDVRGGLPGPIPRGPLLAGIRKRLDRANRAVSGTGSFFAAPIRVFEIVLRTSDTTRFASEILQEGPARDARFALVLQNPREAIPLFETALRGLPSDPDLRFELALALHLAGMDERATQALADLALGDLDAFRRIIEDAEWAFSAEEARFLGGFFHAQAEAPDPGSDAPRLALRGFCRQRVFRHTEAVVDLGRALEVDDRDLYRSLRAASLQALRSAEQAQQDLDAILPERRSEFEPKAFYRRVFSGPPPEGRETFLRTVWQTLSHHVAQNRLGDAYQLLTRAHDLDPQEPDYLLERARVLIRGGDYMSARLDLLAALDLAPQKPNPHYELARTHIIFGDKRNARRHLDLARKKGFQDLGPTLKRDPFFQAHLKDPAFQGLVEE